MIGDIAYWGVFVAMVVCVFKGMRSAGRFWLTDEQNRELEETWERREARKRLRRQRARARRRAHRAGA